MNYRTRSALICIAIALCILVSSNAAHAQQTQTSSYQAMSDKFFNMMQQGKTTEAVDYMLGTNPAMKKVPDQIDQLKAQFASLGAMAGPYISHTMLTESKVAGMYVYQHYFVAYERQPISIRIKYYKPGATWVCYGLQFDANLTDEIQKAADDRVPIDMK